MVDIEERRTRRKGTTFLLVVAAIAFLLAAFTRLLGIDGGRYMVATTALTPYFTAAGVLLVREAGGRVCDFRGTAIAKLDVAQARGRQVVAGNVKLVDPLLRTIQTSGYLATFS